MTNFIDAITLAENRVLADLPPDLQSSLARQLSVVKLLRKQTLVEPGEALSYAYFPTTTLLALEMTTADGHSLELTGIGRTGVLLGLADAPAWPCRVTVQVAGAALRLSTSDLAVAASRHPAVRQMLRDQTARLVQEMAEAGLCHCAHNTLQRLSNWLLRTGSALDTEIIPVTNAQLMFALGVCRSTIGHAIAELQAAGAIWSRRGAIRIHHRGRLELTACGCLGRRVGR